MLRFYSGNDHKHSSYSRMTDLVLITHSPSHTQQQASTRARNLKGVNRARLNKNRKMKVMEELRQCKFTVNFIRVGDLLESCCP